MKILSEQDKQLLCQISTDNASGNHLLHPRSEEYALMRYELSLARTTSMPTARQVHLLAYLTCCDWPCTVTGQYEDLTFNEFEQL